MIMDHVPVDLLQSFVAVADAGSFTGAARLLGLQQSTVSQHIRRLEEQTGRRLFDRSTHRVGLTPDGDVLLDHARSILERYAHLQQYLSAAPLRGRLRFGASEDFVLSALPNVLAAFARRHPELDIELHSGLSEDLRTSFDAGRLDLALVKRRDGDSRGRIAWKEPIEWMAHPEFRLDPDSPLPLILYPPPSITRVGVLETLEAAGRRWRIAFTSANVSGLSAAARAGIGLLPHSVRLMPPGLTILPSREGLPKLPDIQFAVILPDHPPPAVEALAATIMNWAGPRDRQS
ncbi:LysR family transcriptional regulator [Tardiphaga robiniae]|jgi:DNA-binding transcriptional LysR family regulator|uniref:LysR family transcriptional regulator n=2 Tax=Tardiphaga robiniae TaxID=943830 RepID=A0A164AHE4_9BRAD|nr:LysR family transcriptional regulator [Tardiphaga robiniae]